MKHYKLLIEKILWSLAPLAWGAFVWFMTWGQGALLVSWGSLSIQLNNLVRVLVAFLIINFFFKSALNKAAKNNIVQFFGYPITLPSWWIVIVLTFLGIGMSFTPLWKYETIQSLVLGVLVSAIIEEFITRSFFIKYKMDLLEFIFFNTLSSLTFTLMHSFYVKEGVGFIDLMQRGHFGFSFMLGIIVYKTQRIELSIILHMLSNFLRYTIPVCLLRCPWPSPIAIIFSTLFDILFYLCVAGCYKEKVD